MLVNVKERKKKEKEKQTKNTTVTSLVDQDIDDVMHINNSIQQVGYVLCIVILALCRESTYSIPITILTMGVKYPFN